MSRRLWPAWGALLAFGAYLFSLSHLSIGARPKASPELLTSMPWAVQLLFAGGDRYLAANLNGFRALVTTTVNMDADDYRVLARVQTDLSRLNPRHEDNYYIATAILPWAGEVDAAQFVLQRAGETRPKDWLPYFHYGFNRYHFFRDTGGAAGALQQAIPAARAGGDEQSVIALQMLALRWTERGYSTQAAAGVVAAMAETSPAGAVKNYLQKRAGRLQALDALQLAVERYRQQRNKAPNRLEDLLEAGVLDRIPVDPFGVGFTLDESGAPVLRGAVRTS